MLYKGAKPTGEHTGTMPPFPACVTSHRALRALAARRSLLQMDSQKTQPTFRLNSHFDNSCYSRSLRYAFTDFPPCSLRRAPLLQNSFACRVWR